MIKLILTAPSLGLPTEICSPEENRLCTHMRKDRSQHLLCEMGRKKYIFSTVPSRSNNILHSIAMMTTAGTYKHLPHT